MYCENCGAFIPENAKFCPGCGKTVIYDLKPASLFCPNCGAELEPDSLFCENCGQKLDGAGFTADIPSVPEMQQRSSFSPTAPSQSEKSGVSGLPPVPPAPPAGPVPPAAETVKRRSASRKEPKRKKKSGCAVVVLVILILLDLAAGYYYLNVYDGSKGDPISNIISLIKPTAEAVLTKIPETINGNSAKSTAVPAPTVSVATAIPQVKGNGSYDAEKYSTSERSRLSDFLWVTQDIAHGSLPEGIDRLTGFDQLLGGWKAFIIDDLNGQYGSGIERLCLVNFSKDANGNAMAFNWDYVHNTKTDEGYDDNTPPATFYGEYQNGRFYGLGTGSIEMPVFYFLNGHEYAVGTLHWPDSSLGTVFLVRP